MTMMVALVAMLLQVAPAGAIVQQKKTTTKSVSSGREGYVASAGTAVSLAYKRVVFEGESLDCSVMIPNWVAVKVLQHQITLKGWTVPMSNVEVLEGPFKGLTGYLRSDWVRWERRQAPDLGAVLRSKTKPPDPCPIGYNYRK